jgi:Zn-dependent protease
MQTIIAMLSATIISYIFIAFLMKESKNCENEYDLTALAMGIGLFATLAIAGTVGVAIQVFELIGSI